MLVLGTCFCMLMILWHESLEVDHISNKKTGSLTNQLVEWYHQASCLSPDSCFPLSDFRSSSAFHWSDTGMGASVFGLQVKKLPARHQVMLPHVASQRGFAALTCTECLWATNHLQQFPERLLSLLYIIHHELNWSYDIYNRTICIISVIVSSTYTVYIYISYIYIHHHILYIGYIYIYMYVSSCAFYQETPCKKGDKGHWD